VYIPNELNYLSCIIISYKKRCAL